MLDAAIDRPTTLETTVIGAAWLAGMQAGIYQARRPFLNKWHCEKRLQPNITEELRARKYNDWKEAIQKTFS